MNMIFLGAPGAGKGTQAGFVYEKLKTPAISTGKILRAAMKNKTKAGLAAKEYVNAGNLVPDEIVIEMLMERLKEDDCKNGYILDGFPRNLHQARTLKLMDITINLVLYISVTDQEVEDRLCNRRMCKDCNATYNIVVNPSAKGDICEICGGPLIVRKDDKPEIVRERLRIYERETEPLKDYYAEIGKLREVRSCNKVQDTANLVLAAVIKALGEDLKAIGENLHAFGENLKALGESQ